MRHPAPPAPIAPAPVAAAPAAALPEVAAPATEVAKGLPIAKAWRIHLESELAVQRELLRLAEDKTGAIVASDAARLQAIVREELATLDRASELRRRRDALLTLTAGRCGLSGRQAMTAILAGLPEAERNPVETVRAQLRGILDRLRRSTERNQHLLRSGLGLLGAVLDAISGRAGPGGYGRGGALVASDPRGGGLLDARV